MSDTPICTVRRRSIRTAAKFEGKPLSISRFIATAGVAGPTLTVTAAQHGREINGIESVRRLLEWIAGKPLRGTLQVFPVVNRPGVQAVQQTVPGESQNLNRVWPGSSDGTVTERIAAAIAPHVVRSDYLIDLHGWSNLTVPAALVWAAKRIR